MSRDEVATSPHDSKFYSPRDKQNPVGSYSTSHIPRFSSPDQQAAPPKHQSKSISDQPQFHPIRQTRNRQVHQTSRTTHIPQNPPDIAHSRHSPAILQQKPSLPQRPCLPPNAGPLVGGSVLVMASPARFCDQCGSRYLSETSKFCSECGLSRQNVQKKVGMDSRSERVTRRNEGAASPHDSKLYSPRDKQNPVGSDLTSHIPKFSEFHKAYYSSSIAAAQGFTFNAKSPNLPAAPSKHQTQPISHGRTVPTLAKSRDKRKQCEECGTYYREGVKVCDCDEWTQCTVCGSDFLTDWEDCFKCSKSKRRK